MRTAAVFLVLLASPALGQIPITPKPITHPVGYLRIPWNANQARAFPLASIDNAFIAHVGTDLWIHEVDGTDRLLVKGDQPEKRLTAVHDWCVSLDKKLIYYSHVRTFADRPNKLYADLFVIPAAGGTAKQLTDAYNEHLPPTGVWPKDGSGNPSHIQVWNTAPCDTPEGIVFTSTRNGVKSPVQGHATLQLFRMDHDGSNVEKIGYMNLGDVLHPHYFEGYVYFSTQEAQGMRGGGYGNWKIKPDGTDWQPVVSDIPPGFSRGWHRIGHSSDGGTLIESYYDNNTIGDALKIPRFVAGPFAPPTTFGSPDKLKNPFVWTGWRPRIHTFVQSGNADRWPFQPRGLYSLFPSASEADGVDLDVNGGPIPHIGMPWGGPGNTVFLTTTGLMLERYNYGIWMIPDASVTHYVPPEGPLPFSDQLKDYAQVVIDKPDVHEWDAKAIASYEEIYGTKAPPMTPSPVATELPDGSPFAVIGTSSVDDAELVNKQAKVVTYNPEDAQWVKIILTNPTQKLSNGTLARVLGVNVNEGFTSAANERLSSFPLIPIKKWVDANGKIAHMGPNPPPGLTRLMGPDGKPDSSFLAEIPADQSFTVQLLNAKLEAILEATADTWHQLRPRERRTDCRGCHEHWQPDQFDITETAAYRADYQRMRLAQATLVEYYRDIEPIDRKYTLGIGPVPYNTRLPHWAIYCSSINAIDDDPKLTDAEAKLIRRWQDEGMLATGTRLGTTDRFTAESGGGAFADTQPPTIAPTFYADSTLVGHTDPQTGFKTGSLSVKCSEAVAGREANAELVDLGKIEHPDSVGGGILRIPQGLPEGSIVTITGRDNQRALGPTGLLVSEEGNLTKHVLKVKHKSDPPPPPPPPDPDQPQIDALNARNAEIDQRLRELDEEKRDLESEKQENLDEIERLKNN